MSARRIAALLVTVAVLVGCQPAPASSPTASGGATIDKNGMLTVGMGAYPDSFSPDLSRFTGGLSIWRAVFESLIKPNPVNGKLEPGLATSWTAMDATTWELKLRSGVKWHDGTTFSADDVVTTFDKVLNGTPPAEYRNRIAQVTDVKKVDDLTVRLSTGTTPSGILPLGLADIFIHPAKQIKDAGLDAVNKQPIGTGPLAYVSREQGVSVTLKRFDGYWGTPATLGTVVFRSFPEDATRVAALERGEIDIAFNTPPDEASRLEGTGKVKMATGGIGQAMMVSFATASTVISKPLQDVRVRRALNYAVDKQSLIRDLLNNYTQAMGQSVGPDGAGYNPDVKPYAYDPDQAKRLLTEAGYPNGFSFSLSAGTGRWLKGTEIPQAIAGQLKKVGIDAKVELSDYAGMFTKVAAASLESYYIGWNYYPVMDADFNLQHFTCGSRYKQMCDPSYDTLFNTERSTTDPEKRVTILRQMEQILHDNAPVIFLLQTPDVFGVRTRVQGFKPTADDTIHFDGVTVTTDK
jgi:peptide/nickel transport system substrate-binding protein